jgi:hypothetical protein
MMQANCKARTTVRSCLEAVRQPLESVTSTAFSLARSCSVLLLKQSCIYLDVGIDDYIAIFPIKQRDGARRICTPFARGARPAALPRIYMRVCRGHFTLILGE